MVLKFKIFFQLFWGSSMFKSTESSFKVYKEFRTFFHGKEVYIYDANT